MRTTAVSIVSPGSGVSVPALAIAPPDASGGILAGVAQAATSARPMINRALYFIFPFDIETPVSKIVGRQREIDRLILDWPMPARQTGFRSARHRIATASTARRPRSP